MRVLLFIFSVLFSILIYSQEIGNNVYVKHTEYRINNYGSFFQDLILNDSGLIIIRRGSKRNVVFTRSYVDSVFVPMKELDGILVNQLYTKVNLTYCAGDFFPRQLLGDGIGGPLDKLYFVCSGSVDTILSSNSSSPDQEYYSEYQFVWNEIVMCINALIPAKYSRFTLALPYKPDMRAILKYRKIRKEKSP